MKIKGWLIVSYLIVMVLPVAFLLLLVQLIQSYDQKQEMLDYFDVQEKLDLYERILDNPALYKKEDPNEYERLRNYSQEKIIFTLYNKDGLMLFSTDANAQFLSKVKRESIYQDLYKIQTNYHSFDYKKPVFENDSIIGFYEISFLRLDWLSGVEDRESLAIILYLVAFFIIYAIVIYFLNKKLFHPLKKLMEQMSLFAKGKDMITLPRQNDEMGDLITHFEMMQKEIVEKNKALLHAQEQKQYMIASISHDLKTPLTTIRVSAESLLHETKKGTPKLNTIINKADYIHQLIDELTIYNIMQSQQYELETVEVDGQEFFEMALSDYEELAEVAHITLHREVYVQGYYQVNTKQFLRLFDNLLVNALHHTQEGHNVWAAVLSTSMRIPDYVFSEARIFMEGFGDTLNGLWIIVQNEGETIPSEDYEKLFEPLYQRDPSRNKNTFKGNRGSGLGLSISKMIIEKHGGQIFVRSTMEKGCTFLCYLPEEKR